VFLEAKILKSSLLFFCKLILPSKTTFTSQVKWRTVKYHYILTLFNTVAFYSQMRRWSRARGGLRKMWRLATSWRARRRAFRSTRPSVRGLRGPCRLCPCHRPSPLDSGWWRRSTPAQDPPIPRLISRWKKKQKRSCRGQPPVQKNKRPGGRKTPTRGGWTIFLYVFLIFFLTNNWFFLFYSIFVPVKWLFCQWRYILMWIFFFINVENFGC